MLDCWVLDVPAKVLVVVDAQAILPLNIDCFLVIDYFFIQQVLIRFRLLFDILSEMF